VDKEFKGGRTDIDADYIEMLICNFNNSISKNLNTVYLGYEILNENEIKEYSIARNDWLKTLNLFLKTAINLEEYESCTQIQNIINSLS
jgi:hypothetical protein